MIYDNKVTNEENIRAANRNYAIAQDRMGMLPRYYKWFFSLLKPHIFGNVLELGGGSGHFLRTFIEQVDSVTIVDLDEALVERAKTVHGGKIYGEVRDLSGDWGKLGEVCYDSIIVMDLLEHIEDDEEFLRKVAECMKERKSKLIVKVPANKNLYSKVDIASGHFRRYDVEDLIEMARRAGLRLVWGRQVNKIGAIIYRLKKDQDKNFSRTFDDRILVFGNVVIPLVRLADIVLPGSGLSYVAVFDKIGK